MGITQELGRGYWHLVVRNGPVGDAAVVVECTGSGKGIGPVEVGDNIEV